MDELFGHLERYDNLELSIIRTTRIDTVLKKIINLTPVPNKDDDYYNFKKRSSIILERWKSLG